jgi:hypothetical protein
MRPDELEATSTRRRTWSRSPRRVAPRPHAPALRWSRQNAEKAPSVADALQLVVARNFEAKTGTCNEVFHGLGDEHLGRPGVRRHPRTDRDGDARALTIDKLTLARVQTGPDLDPEFSNAFGDLEGANDRSSPSKVA